MVTIPIFNYPSYTPTPAADFSGLGDLANVYRKAEQDRLKQQQDATAQQLAAAGFAQMNGQPGPQAPQTPTGAGWLSQLMGLQQPQPQTQPQTQQQPPQVQPQAAAPQGDIVNTYGRQTSNAESGGPEGNYRAVGPPARSGDRAYGRYQVMGGNIPEWTQEYYGQRLTPQQFLLNPQAQDAVYRGKFGEYLGKYGPEGAHRAWFAGERGMNNPNANDGYHDMNWYMARTGQVPAGGAAPAPYQVASLGAVPPPTAGGAPSDNIQIAARTVAPPNVQQPPTQTSPPPPPGEDQRAASAGPSPVQVAQEAGVRRMPVMTPELFGALWANPNTRDFAVSYLKRSQSLEDIARQEQAMKGLSTALGGMYSSGGGDESSASAVAPAPRVAVPATAPATGPEASGEGGGGGGDTTATSATTPPPAPPAPQPQLTYRQPPASDADQKIRTLITASMNPYLSKEQHATVQTLLTKALNDAKPPDKIATLQAIKDSDPKLANKSLFEVEMMLREKAASRIIMPEGEKEYDKTINQVLAKYHAGAIEDSLNSGKNKTTLDTAERAMTAPGFYSGALSPAVTSAQKALVGLGILDAGDASGNELFQKLQNKAIMDAGGTKSGLGPQISNADANIIKGSTFNSENTPQGNRRIIGYLRMMEDRKVAFARELNRVAKENGNRLPIDISERMADWAEKNPLDFSKFMTKEEIAKAAEAGKRVNEEGFNPNPTTTTSPPASVPAAPASRKGWSIVK